MKKPFFIILIICFISQVQGFFSLGFNLGKVSTPSKVTSTLNLKSQTSSISATEDYKTQMAKLISQLKFVDTPKGKQLLNDLTNQLFAIYNTLNKIGNSSINQILYKDSLRSQVEKFLQTVEKIQGIGQQVTKSDVSFLAGSQNIVIGQGSLVEGNNNKVHGNDTLVRGTQNMISGNKSITTGGSNIVIGNNTFVVGNDNTASGNNTFVFATNSSVNKNNALVVGNYTVDLNQLKSNSLTGNFLSSSKK